MDKREKRTFLRPYYEKHEVVSTHHHVPPLLRPTSHRIILGAQHGKSVTIQHSTSAWCRCPRCATFPSHFPEKVSPRFSKMYIYKGADKEPTSSGRCPKPILSRVAVSHMSRCSPVIMGRLVAPLSSMWSGAPQRTDHVEDPHAEA